VSPCDAAVVGAGPAGAWAAYTLARRGARVTIFDPSHPREKPCGGGVTGRALALVADAIDGAQFPQSVIRSARFVDSGSGSEVTITSRGDRVRGGFCVSAALSLSKGELIRTGTVGPYGPNGRVADRGKPPYLRAGPARDARRGARWPARASQN
jgi:hypothetical protein